MKNRLWIIFGVVGIFLVGCDAYFDHINSSQSESTIQIQLQTTTSTSVANVEVAQVTTLPSDNQGLYIIRKVTSDTTGLATFNMIGYAATSAKPVYFAALRATDTGFEVIGETSVLGYQLGQEAYRVLTITK